MPYLVTVPADIVLPRVVALRAPSYNQTYFTLKIYSPEQYAMIRPM